MELRFGNPPIQSNEERQIFAQDPKKEIVTVPSRLFIFKKSTLCAKFVIYKGNYSSFTAINKTPILDYPC